MEAEGGREQLRVVDVGAQAGLDPPSMYRVPSAEHHVFFFLNSLVLF